jgi:DNA repair protein RecO (recombination protein O)
VSLHRLEGLVLRARDLGEADKIVTVLTRERGKMDAVGRGARRGRSRLLGLVQPFTHGDFMLFLNKRSLHTLSQGVIVRSFRKLREDLFLMAYAAHFTEIVYVAVPEEEPAESLFEITLEALRLLDNGEIAPSLVSRWFELHTLDVLGYHPELGECVRCRHPFVAGKQVTLMYSIAEGGLLCPSCAHVDPQAMSIGGAVWQSMRFLLQAPSSRLVSFRLTAAEDASMEALLRHTFEYRLEARLEAWDFLQSIRLSEQREGREEQSGNRRSSDKS